MKSSTVKVIEEISQIPESLDVNVKFTLLYKPKKDSLEVKEYSHTTKISQNELVQVVTSGKELSDKYRLRLAESVFSKFYIDNFLTPTN